MGKDIIGRELSGEEAIVHTLIRNKNGTYTVSGEVIIYVKTKNCSKNYDFDVALHVDFNGTVEGD